MSDKVKAIVEELSKLTIKDINEIANWLESLIVKNEDV